MNGTFHDLGRHSWKLNRGSAYLSNVARTSGFIPRSLPVVSLFPPSSLPGVILPIEVFRGKGRNRALNIGARIGIIEKVCVRTLKSRRRKRKRGRGGKEIKREREREKEREKYEGARKRIGRKGEAPRWSYDGNGVRHLTGWRRVDREEGRWRRSRIVFVLDGCNDSGMVRLYGYTRQLNSFRLLLLIKRPRYFCYVSLA